MLCAANEASDFADLSSDILANKVGGQALGVIADEASRRNDCPNRGRLPTTASIRTYGEGSGRARTSFSYVRPNASSLLVTSAVWSSIRLKPRPYGRFTSYLKTGSVPKLKKALDRDDVVSKIRVSRKGNRSGGQSFSRGALYELLSNPIYIGEIRHKRERHPDSMKRFWTELYGKRSKSVCEIASIGRPSIEPKCHRVR